MPSRIEYALCFKIKIYSIYFEFLANFLAHFEKMGRHPMQGLVKGAKLSFRYPYFYFRHGESTSTASQLTSPASQKSKDLKKVLLILQDLEAHRHIN